MSKRLLLLSMLSIGWMSVTHADNGLKGKKSKSPAKWKADTTVLVKTTTSLGTVDANSSFSIKNNNVPGFNDLFIASSMTASNGSHLNPRAISFVQDYVEKNKEELTEMKSWGRPYFNLIDGILTQYGLPRELKYLAVIESNLKPTSVSWAGAVGPWQLMPATARILGLKVSHHYDERTNYYKSTKAAARYLKDLYTELGDWLLVIAAYNGGTANVYHAIKRSHSTNFWTLQYYLPAESRNHVKKFIGTHYIFEGQGGVTTLTKEEATEQLSGSSMYVFARKLSKLELSNAKTISISGKYYSEVIAKYVVMDLQEFNRYNPDFDKVMASSNNTYDLLLPADKIDLFDANKYQILNESIQSLLSGETADNDSPKTLQDIAKKVNK
jgi:membrane-bound lytic murein transglycosylase D